MILRESFDPILWRAWARVSDYHSAELDSTAKQVLTASGLTTFQVTILILPESEPNWRPFEVTRSPRSRSPRQARDDPRFGPAQRGRRHQEPLS